jgi:hypothetical protein
MFVMYTLCDIYKTETFTTELQHYYLFPQKLIQSTHINYKIDQDPLYDVPVSHHAPTAELEHYVREHTLAMPEMTYCPCSFVRF